MSLRKNYVDIAKGILILFVVLAHSPISNYEPINWFHMPAFLILSGFTFNIPSNIMVWVKKNSKRLLIPYMSFYLINITLMLMFVVDFTFVRLVKYLAGGVYSGRMIPGVFWFITTLFITQILFVILNKKIKNNKIIFAIIGVLYVLAHIISSNYYAVGVYEAVKSLPITPWNIDVIPMMMFYFSLGYYGKNIINIIYNKMNTAYILLVGSICVAFYYINQYLGGTYWLNMKYGRYNYYILDILVPVVFTIMIIGVSKYIEDIKISKILMLFGMYTFPIMYLHIPITEVMKCFTTVGPIMFNVVSIIVGYIFILGIRKNKYMDFFFNGKGNLKEIIKV